jgi:hypothetical protein
MSIIALIIAPLLKGKESWGLWYYGLIPIGLMVFGTYCVYHFFWRDAADVSADVSENVFADEEVAKLQGYEKANDE